LGACRSDLPGIRWIAVFHFPILAALSPHFSTSSENTRYTSNDPLANPQPIPRGFPQNRPGFESRSPTGIQKHSDSFTGISVGIERLPAPGIVESPANLFSRTVSQH
jgi:hypothetical protein